VLSNIRFLGLKSGTFRALHRPEALCFGAIWLGCRATFLRLAETLTTFLGRLRSAADTLDIIERQRIVRLVVKDILIVTTVSSPVIVSPLAWRLRRKAARQLPVNPTQSLIPASRLVLMRGRLC
jgi:hypothetical protein